MLVHTLRSTQYTFVCISTHVEYSTVYCNMPRIACRSLLMERVQSLLNIIGSMCAERGAPLFEAELDDESDSEREGPREPRALELGSQHSELLTWLRSLMPPAFSHAQLVDETTASVRVLNNAW